MDVDAVLHTSSQLMSTLQPLCGVSSKTVLLLEDVNALTNILQQVRDTTFDQELSSMYDPIWECLHAADERIAEVVTEFERRIITIRAEVTEHLRAVNEVTNVAFDGTDKLEGGSELEISHSRIAEAQFDAEVVAWETAPKDSSDPLGLPTGPAGEGYLDSVSDNSTTMSRYFPDENNAFRINHDSELAAIHSYFTDPSRREAALVSDHWVPVVSFLFREEGGSGKTELAKHFCHTYKANYKFMAWINASDTSTILSSFKKCLSYVKKNHRAYFEKNFPISDAKQHAYDAPLITSVIVGFVIRWLESLTAPWLMVIDNMGNYSDLPTPIKFGSGSGDGDEEQQSSTEAHKLYMLVRSLSYMLPRKCGPRVIGNILVTGKRDRRSEWQSIMPCNLYSPGDRSAALPFTGTLSVQSIEHLFFSFLLENDVNPVVSPTNSDLSSGEIKRQREVLERDIVACGMDLVNALHANPLAVVQALAAIREVRQAFRLHRPKLQSDSSSTGQSSVPRQLALEAPPTISDYLGWMKVFSESAESSFPEIPEMEASYKSVLTTIACVVEKIPSIRIWTFKRALELLAFSSPHSIDLGLLQLFLHPPHTPLHVRVLGKWRLPNSVMVRLQDAEFEFEVESVFPLTLLNNSKRFKLRAFRSYMQIRDAHNAMSKLYCAEAAKLRFPSAILPANSDGNAEDAVSVRRAELSSFFKGLSKCPCWGILCTTSALHALFGLVPDKSSDLVCKVGTDSIFYPCDPLNVYMNCSPEFLRLASPLVSLSLLSVTHSELLVPTEDTGTSARNPFSSAFGMGEQSASEKFNRRLECSMCKSTQMSLQMWLSIEGQYDAALNSAVRFFDFILKTANAAAKKTRLKPHTTLQSTVKSSPGNILAAAGATAVCEAEYVDNSVLPHVFNIILETPVESAEFISMAAECFDRAVAVPIMYDKAELCCQRCLDIIDKRGASVPNGAGSMLEASWYVRYADILSLTSRKDKARSLYEHGLKVYRKAPPGQEDVAGILSIMKKLGKVYFEDGRFKQAERIFEESLELSRVLNAQDPEQLAIDLCDYATVRSAGAVDLSTIQHCIRIKNEEIELLKSVFGEKSVDFARCANSIGELEKRIGRTDAAKDWFEKSLDALVSFNSGSHPDMTAALYNMALLSHGEGDYNRAQRMYEKAIEIDAMNFGENHLDAANIHDSLGILLCDQGHYDLGLDHLRIACDLHESIGGNSSRDAILSLNSLGYAYMKMNEAALGISVYEKALEALRQRDNRQDDDVTAQTLNALGEAHAAAGRFTEARRLFMEAYGLRISVLGDKHPDTANVMKNLATVAFARGSYTEAREMALGALRIYRAKYGSDSIHESIIPILSDLGEIYHKLGKVNEANAYFEEALQARRSSKVKNSAYKLGILLISYARSLKESSSFAESSQKYAEALRILRDLHDPNTGLGSVQLADCIFEFAAVKRTMGLVDDARELIEECLALRHALFGDESEPVAATLMLLSEILVQRKELDAAMDAGEECARIRAGLYGISNNPLVAETLQAVAKITLLKGKGEEALAIFRDALSIYDNIFAATSSSGKDDDDLSQKLQKDTPGDFRAMGITMTSLMHQIASILAEKLCFIEATAMFERCLDWRRRIFGEEHGEVASALHCIADISYQRGRFEEALEIHSIGHAIRNHCFGAEDVLTAASDCYLAMCELAVGRVDNARDKFESAVHCFRNRFGDSSIYVATGLHYLSKAFLALKDFESAVIVEEKALDILLEVEGRESGYVVDVLSCIGDAFRAQDKPSAARKHYVKALEIVKSLDRQCSAVKLSTSRGFQGLRFSNSRASQSTKVASRVDGFSLLSLEHCKDGGNVISASGAFESKEKSVGRVLALYERMIWALDGVHSPIEADAFAEEALDMYSTAFGIDSPEMVPLLRMLGLRQRRRGDYSGAIPFLEKAMWIQETTVDSWSEEDADDEAIRRERSCFVEEAIMNISDLTWLLDKQGKKSDTAVTREVDSKFSRILSNLRSSGPAGGRRGLVPEQTHLFKDSSSLLSYATSEKRTENSNKSGSAHSLLSNFSLFSSAKSE